jgi:hypothetical protein
MSNNPFRFLGAFDKLTPITLARQLNAAIDMACAEVDRLSRNVRVRVSRKPIAFFRHFNFSSLTGQQELIEHVDVAVIAAASYYDMLLSCFVSLCSHASIPLV